MKKYDYKIIRYDGAHSIQPHLDKGWEPVPNVSIVTGPQTTSVFLRKEK